MSDDKMDLVARLRGASNWLRQGFGDWKSVTSAYDRTPFEAADEIERLRAALSEPGLTDDWIKEEAWLSHHLPIGTPVIMCSVLRDILTVDEQSGKLLSRLITPTQSANKEQP